MVFPSPSLSSLIASSFSASLRPSPARTKKRPLPTFSPEYISYAVTSSPAFFYFEPPEWPGSNETSSVYLSIRDQDGLSNWLLEYCGGQAIPFHTHCLLQLTFWFGAYVSHVFLCHDDSWINMLHLVFFFLFMILLVVPYCIIWCICGWLIIQEVEIGFVACLSGTYWLLGILREALV